MSRPSERGATENSRPARPSSRSSHNARWSSRSIGLNTLIAGSDSTAIFRAVPEPYLINPLTHGPLDTESIEENEAAYQRYSYFKELNSAARSNRPPFYGDDVLGNGSCGSWMVIYFNVAWAKFLRQLDTSDPRISQTEDDIRLQVEQDAKVKLPDTDLSTAMQNILKEYDGPYLIDEEVRRRLEIRAALLTKRRQSQQPRNSLVSANPLPSTAQTPPNEPFDAEEAELAFQALRDDLAAHADNSVGPADPKRGHTKVRVQEKKKTDASPSMLKRMASLFKKKQNR